jgi:hypothetical protein
MSHIVSNHYSKPEVKKEIAEYCKGRWVAVHCEKTDIRGLRIMIRYESADRKPLTIDSEKDLSNIFNKYREYSPRAFYATAHSYLKLKSWEDLMDRQNIILSSPTWDIDSKDYDWRKVVGKALEILKILEDNGIVKSVFFKWSGNGAHIHINHYAFSIDIRSRIDPLDIAYSITQYIINRLEPTEGIVVENKIDIQRVFTTPLSLHRSVDRVAVCIPPEKLEDFDISWTNPDSHVHFPESWRRYVEGEGDELAEKAFTAIGPYVSGKRKIRKHPPLDREILGAFEKFRESF